MRSVPDLTPFPPPGLGREAKRLTPKFALRGVGFEQGFRRALVDACGGRDGYGFALGRALHRHVCGIWGPVSHADRVLNDFVLKMRQERTGWLLSQHRVGGVLVQISTELASGETWVRRATPLTQRLVREEE